MKIDVQAEGQTQLPKAVLEVVEEEECSLAKKSTFLLR
jgi:hypothetical protein